MIKNKLSCSYIVLGTENLLHRLSESFKITTVATYEVVGSNDTAEAKSRSGATASDEALIVV